MPQLVMATEVRVVRFTKTATVTLTPITIPASPTQIRAWFERRGGRFIETCTGHVRMPITDSGRMAISGQSYMAAAGQNPMSADTGVSGS